MEDSNRDKLLLSLEPYSKHLNSLADAFILHGPEPDFVKKCILVASLRKVSRQIEAVITLSRSGFVEESTAIARMLIEAIVNAIYLQTSEEAEIDRFLKYDSQRISADYVSKYLEQGRNHEAAIKTKELTAQSLRSGLPKKAITWSAKKLHERAKIADLDCDFPVFNELQNWISRVSNFAVHSTLISMIHLFPRPVETGGFPQRQTLHEQCLQLVELALKAFTNYGIKSAKAHLAQVKGEAV